MVSFSQIFALNEAIVLHVFLFVVYEWIIAQNQHAAA